MNRLAKIIATTFIVVATAVVGISLSSLFWMGMEIQHMTIRTTVLIAGVVCLLNQWVYMSRLKNVNIGRIAYFVCLALSIVASISQIDEVQHALSLEYGWLFDGVSVACLISGAVASYYYLRYTSSQPDNFTIVLAPAVSTLTAVAVGVGLSIVAEILPMLKPIFPYVALVGAYVALGIYIYEKKMLPYSDGVVLKVSKGSGMSRPTRKKAQPLSLVMDEMYKIASRHSYGRKCTFDSTLDIDIKSECQGGDIVFLINARCRVGKGARTDYDVERVRDSVDGILSNLDNVLVSEAQSVLRRAQESYTSYNIDYRITTKIAEYKIIR